MIVPVREEEDGLAAATKEAAPLPVPAPAPLMVIQGAAVEAVQLHVGVEAITLNAPDPPAASMELEFALSA